MGLYRLHGLLVQSPVALAASQVSVGSPDVVLEVRSGDVSEAVGEIAFRSPGQGASTGHVVTRAAGMWTITLPDVATASFSPLSRSVTITVHSSVSPLLVPILISGPILVTLAMSRGHNLLHSSAVSWGAIGAVALVGRSGAGKSSIARLLTARDRPLLSDDALRVDVAEQVQVHCGTTTSRLRTTVAVDHDDRTTTTVDGRILVSDDDGSVPETDHLSVLLQPLLSSAFERVRLRPLTAAQAVLVIASSWPLDGVCAEDLLAERLRWAASLTPRVPVLAFEVPWSGSSGSVDRAALVDAIEAWLEHRELEVSER